MNCPQCSYPLIESESKDDSAQLATSQSLYIPTSTYPSTYPVGSGYLVGTTGSGTWSQSTPVGKTYNCPKCHISIKIDDDKKSKEKKELMRIIEGLVEQKNRCDERVKAFNARWGDNQSIERLEALLILK